MDNKSTNPGVRISGLTAIDIRRNNYFKVSLTVECDSFRNVYTGILGYKTSCYICDMSDSR